MIRKTLLFLSFFAVALCSSNLASEEDLLVREPNLAGKPFEPPNPFVFKGKSGNKGLSDWSLIEKPLAIENVRVIILEDYFDGVDGLTCDIMTRDIDILKGFKAALDASWIRRWGYSDLSESRGGFFGGMIGAICISVPDFELVIGIHRRGFYFGEFSGTSHQLFESWYLTKLVDNLVRAEIGRGLKDRDISWLSGEETIKIQQSEYNRLFNEKK